MSIIARLRVAVALVVTVRAAGTIGYRPYGLGWGDALHMTVITVATIGYREVLEPTGWNSLFIVVIIVTGVCAMLYTFMLTVQAVVEGQLREFVGRRIVDRRIDGIRELRSGQIMIANGAVGVDDSCDHLEKAIA